MKANKSAVSEKQMQEKLKNTTPLTDKEGEVRELTEEEFSQARPISDFPELQVLVKLSRGKQKAPTKEAVNIRLSPRVMDYFRSTGKGWQTRMNDVLCDYVDRQG